MIDKIKLIDTLIITPAPPDISPTETPGVAFFVSVAADVTGDGLLIY
jgi:hypothetical protein